jgi:hypothetical protein
MKKIFGLLTCLELTVASLSVVTAADDMFEAEKRAKYAKEKRLVAGYALSSLSALIPTPDIVERLYSKEVLGRLRTECLDRAKSIVTRIDANEKLLLELGQLSDLSGNFNQPDILEKMQQIKGMVTAKRNEVDRADYSELTDISKCLTETGEQFFARCEQPVKTSITWVLDQHYDDAAWLSELYLQLQAKQLPLLKKAYDVANNFVDKHFPQDDMPEDDGPGSQKRLAFKGLLALIALCTDNYRSLGTDYETKIFDYLEKYIFLARKKEKLQCKARIPESRPLGQIGNKSLSNNSTTRERRSTRILQELVRRAFPKIDELSHHSQGLLLEVMLQWASEPVIALLNEFIRKEQKSTIYDLFCAAIDNEWGRSVVTQVLDADDIGAIEAKTAELDSITNRFAGVNKFMKDLHKMEHDTQQMENAFVFPLLEALCRLAQNASNREDMNRILDVVWPLINMIQKPETLHLLLTEKQTLEAIDTLTAGGETLIWQKKNGIVFLSTGDKDVVFLSTEDEGVTINRHTFRSLQDAKTKYDVAQCIAICLENHQRGGAVAKVLCEPIASVPLGAMQREILRRTNTLLKGKAENGEGSAALIPSFTLPDSVISCAKTGLCVLAAIKCTIIPGVKRLENVVIQRHQQRHSESDATQTQDTRSWTEKLKGWAHMFRPLADIPQEVPQTLTDHFFQSMDRSVEIETLFDYVFYRTQRKAIRKMFDRLDPLNEVGIFYIFLQLFGNSRYPRNEIVTRFLAFVQICDFFQVLQFCHEHCTESGFSAIFDDSIINHPGLGLLSWCKNRLFCEKLVSIIRDHVPVSLAQAYDNGRGFLMVTKDGLGFNPGAAASVAPADLAPGRMPAVPGMAPADVDAADLAAAGEFLGIDFNGNMFLRGCFNSSIFGMKE